MNKRNTIKVLLDTVKYTSKPEENINLISNRLIDNLTEINIEDLAKEVTAPNGKSWCPAIFKGNRKNNNWNSQQIFALDFDKGADFIKILDRFKEYSLDCTFAYSTFSDSPELPKYRMVWQLEEVITNIEERKAIQDALTIVANEADKVPANKSDVDLKSNDEARLFFGGKKLIYENYNYYLNINLLKTAASSICVAPFSEKNKGKKINNLKKKFYVEDKRSLLNIYLSNEHISSILDSDNNKVPTTLQHIDFNELRQRVKILDDLINYKWLYYHQLLGLAMNLIYIKGGEKLYKKCLQDSGHPYEIKHFDLPSICKKYKYFPQSLENFSPYEDDWQYTNLLSAAKLERGTVRRIKEPNLMKLIEAEALLDKTLNEALTDTSNSIWIIRKATGLGGTEKLLDLEKNITIALPNHSLKAEISKRFKSDHLITPDLPIDSIDVELKNKLNYLYSIGAITTAHQLIKEESKRNTTLANYLQDTIKAFTSEQTVLTTHSKALFVDFDKHDTVIFDEDPLSSICILEIADVTLDDLNRLVHNISDSADKDNLKKYVDIITRGLFNCVELTKEVSFNDIDAIENAVLADKNYNSSILKFLRSDYYSLDSNEISKLFFLKHNSLNSEILVNKKIIIISATANEYIYKQLYGDRVKFIDISKVGLQGAIIQDTKYSLSRASLKNENVYTQIQNQVKDLPVITFSAYKHLFPNAVPDIHYGKCTGFDDFKGKDLAVVGTPHFKVVQYLLYAKALGIKICPQDFRLELSRVIHNDIEFRITTFTKRELQLIQFHFIEEQLIQAIGRARALREPCIVYLYSGYPLPEACLTDEEKTREETRVKRLKEEKLEKDRIELEQQLSLIPF